MTNIVLTGLIVAAIEHCFIPEYVHLDAVTGLRLLSLSLHLLMGFLIPPEPPKRQTWAQHLTPSAPMATGNLPPALSPHVECQGLLYT